ncbi:MAG TPA: DUF4105 domain-containing protein [Nitrospiria bacterium]|nr:DUF4105 domain-containing protein [Nitrospiria bacterium]
MKSISLFLVFLGLLCSSAPAEETVFLDQILHKAKENKLSDDRYWHILLHYKKTLSGFKSLLDDPRFFLSPKGKTDPPAELEATLKAFFDSTDTGDGHPRCRFPARYEWLKSELNWDDSRFPAVSCEAFKKYESSLQPKSAVLVFPAFFMNNPASMFGHTLLRIDNSSESKLLSFAVNYAAYPDSFGILYPIKGIFGFYKGFFSVFPYYDTIKMYNDTEQRDMWEYQLNLTEDELKKMSLHLWELKEIYSYYYFFGENCSFNILYLFEAARPSLHLTDRVRPWVIPTDTLRLIMEEGVVGKLDYRASKANRIRHIGSLLNEKERVLAREISENKAESGQIASGSPENKIHILDLATEEVQYLYGKHKMTKEDYQKRFLATLNERSKLGRSDGEEKPIAPPDPPDSGHRSSRISLGGGVRESLTFEEIRYRPAYHTLHDPDTGFSKGSQIVFMDTAVRFYNNGIVKLQDFDFIDIVSLSPRDEFFKPLSYQISTGFHQQTTPAGDDLLVYQLNPAVGVAFESPWIGLYYGMIEANLNFSGEYKDNVAFGGGLVVGTIRKITDSWKIAFSAEEISFPFTDIIQEQKASAVQTLKISQNDALLLSLSWDKVNDYQATELSLNWNVYF